MYYQNVRFYSIDKKNQKTDHSKQVHFRDILNGKSHRTLKVALVRIDRNISLGKIFPNL